MVYTEIQTKGKKKYYYRVQSVRDGDKVEKHRKYLGSDLKKGELKKMEREADQELGILSALLTLEELEELKDIKRQYGKLPKATLENRYETFVSKFTHDSTAIEGNTLTLNETARLLFDDITPNAKPMRELLEVINHRDALDHILVYKGKITTEFILKLHKLSIAGTLKPGLGDQEGRYRTYQVYISGVEWMPPPPEVVPKEMKELLTWYTKNKKKLHPIILATYFHIGFEMVHPFVDGNGRVGRLLMNFILHEHGYPMINIPLKRRFDYYDCLEAAQTDGDLRPFVDLLLDLLRKDPILL